MVVGARFPEYTHGQQRHSQLRLLRNSIRAAQHITDPHARQAVDHRNVASCKCPDILRAAALHFADLRDFGLNLLGVVRYRITVADRALVEADEGHTAHAFVPLNIVYEAGQRL
ncbi:hypothetical protein D3C74_405180 [compost metagenome]